MGFLRKLSGREVEDKVSHYSEVFGEVLLGMHRDVERLREIVVEHDAKMQNALSYIARTQAEFSKKSELLDTTLDRAKQYAAEALGSSQAALSAFNRAEVLLGSLRAQMQELQQSQATSLKQLRTYLMATWVVGGVSLIGVLFWILHSRI